MPLYRPTELKAFLNSLGVFPKKSLSQNFLVDGNIIARAISEASVSSDDIVLDIGPGPGAITEALLETGCHVVAVEKDTTFAEALSRLQTSDNRLTVIEGDMLDVDLDAIFPTELLSSRKVKVVANLPFQVAIPILTRLIPRRTLFSDIVILIQDDVALRLTATPGSKMISSITIMLNFYSFPKYVCRVKRTSFYPAPNVDGALVHLQLREPPHVSDPDAFLAMVRKAYQQRRKMLTSTLREYGSEHIASTLTRLGLDSRSRPEMLTLEHFLELFKE